MTREAHELALGKARTYNVSALRRQVERYVRLAKAPGASGGGVPEGAYSAYIDGAMLMQRDACSLFSPWRDETFRPDSSDRDQISFAHVVARERLQITPLDMCTELATGPHKGKSFCHWYLKKDSRRIATLARHKNMVGPRMPLGWRKNGTMRAGEAV